MENIMNVRYVHAHAEGFGGAEDHRFSRFEFLINLLPVFGVHSGVEKINGTASVLV